MTACFLGPLVLEFWVQVFRVEGRVSGPFRSKKRTRNRPQPPLLDQSRALRFQYKCLGKMQFYPFLTPMGLGPISAPHVRPRFFLVFIFFEFRFRFFFAKLVPEKVAQSIPENAPQNGPRNSRTYTPSWGRLGAPWGALGVPWRRLGVVLGRFGGFLGRLQKDKFV